MNTVFGPKSNLFWSTISIGAFWALGLGACSGGDDTNPQQTDASIESCTVDASEDPASGIPLTMGEMATGYICPVQDQDWYRISIPPENRLVTVNVATSAPISPIEPTFAIWALNEDDSAREVLASSPAAPQGVPLNVTSCVEPGDYALVVRDQGDDAEDVRRNYTVSYSTQPDPDTQEPNDARANPTALSDDMPVSGYIACRGDIDWYTIDVPEGFLIRIELTSAVTAYQPTLRFFAAGSEEQLFEGSNRMAGTRDTDIRRALVVSGAGTYELSVSDFDGTRADPAVPYALKVSLVEDLDSNEPNDAPDQATRLSEAGVNCGASWSQEITREGTIGAPGDNDWFSLPLQNCGRGIIEAEVTVHSDSLPTEEQWDFVRNKVQASLTLVRPEDNSPCVTDQSCQSLQVPCQDGLDCGGVFGVCRPDDGTCQGAAVCLPSGFCGANQTQRNFECNPNVAFCQASDTPPPPNVARFAAPLLGENVVYLRVSDFRSDGEAPDTLYTLKVRVREDPDSGEQIKADPTSQDPIQPYFNDVPNGAVPLEAYQDSAPLLQMGDSASGFISYTDDVDVYRYAHPCPGQDCTVRIEYSFDPGPVDILLSVYRQGNRWFDAEDIEELPQHTAISGALGGTSASDKCFFAFQGHEGEPFYYYIVVTDRTGTYPDSTELNPSTEDWSAEQGYSFTVQRVSGSCSVPPCMSGPMGCTAP